MAAQEGLLIRDQTAAGPGKEVHLNAVVPSLVENEHVRGKVLLLHRGEEHWPHASHFVTRKRRWELRLQIQFKPPFVPTECPVLGLEADQGVATNWLLQVALSFTKAINRARGHPFMLSLGSTRETACSRAAHFLLPAWTLDSIVETPVEEEPPSLIDEQAPPMSLQQRQAVQWGREGITYTCIYYSAYIDFVQWELTNLPMRGLLLSSIIGDQALHLVFSDPPSEDGMRPRRYFLDLVLKHGVAEVAALLAHESRDPEEEIVDEVASSCWESCDEISSNASLCDESSRPNMECNNWVENPTESFRSASPMVPLDVNHDIVGVYTRRSNVRRESTLVLQKDASFWHALHVQPKSQEKPRVKCLSLDGLTQRLGVSTPGREPQKVDWELLETIGSYTLDDQGTVILTCEAWRVTAGDTQTLARDCLFWALQRDRELLDRMIDERRLVFRYQLSRKPMAESAACSEVAPVVLLRGGAGDPDPNAQVQATIDDPALNAMAVCLGFSTRYDAPKHPDSPHHTTHEDTHDDE